MPTKPRQDHYVAETYLRHFTGPGRMLRAYRKSDGRTFPCWPRDVCKEPNGDTIPDFLSEPSFLGEYRENFEPFWNGAVKSLAERKFGIWQKQTIAGYWANLLVCTPTWKRLGILTYDKMAVDYLEAHQTFSEKSGKTDLDMAEAVKLLRDGRITLKTETDYIRAQNARNIIKYMWRIYNARWHVLLNDTDVDYVTSDNPASFEDQGEWSGRPPPFVRYLPITPRICLSCDLTEGYANRDEKPNFKLAPRGGLQGINVSSAIVRHVNVCTAKCAEDLVFTGTESDGVRR